LNYIAATSAQDALEKIFGYKEFRASQKEIIDCALAGDDFLGVMPTGGGKSLCYQIPPLVEGRFCVVVSPLISLMKDQVDQLQACGVAATFLNSTLDDSEYRRRVGDLRAGRIQFLYVAPETLLLPWLPDLLSSLDLGFLAVDEAHCISEWGHEFRPEYRRLAEIRQNHPQAVCMALTATATPTVRRDIRKQLHIDKKQEFVSGFDRPNLFLEVAEKDAPLDQVIEFVERWQGEAGIVYCQSRKQVDELYSDLKQAGYKALPYHAGLSDRERQDNQDAFVRDEITIIVATIAFGMGINKSNVRFVVHYDLPKSVEAYYQQIGRAGRDGLDSHCLLLYRYGDKYKQQFFIDQMEGPEKELAQKQLSEILRFAGEEESCRRKPLLHYFGEQYKTQNCAMCDICTGETRSGVDMSIAAQKFLSAVKRVEERFGMHHVIDVLRGSKNQKIMQMGHEQLSVYGIGKEESKAEWIYLAERLLLKGYLEQGEHKALRLTQAAWKILRGEERFVLMLEQTRNGKKSSNAKKGKVSSDRNKKYRTKHNTERPELFEELRRLRKRLADERGVPPYVVFSDKVLLEMCEYTPRTQDDMLAINGVGYKKWEEYGDDFVNCILQNS
jgi:ATP-dependent DNA helicase RecQ